MVFAFHSCGGNVGDVVSIPLPGWILEVGRKDPDIFYRDSEGSPDPEYLSLGVDTFPLFAGRTPIQLYGDFMSNFSAAFQQYMDNTITHIKVCHC